MTGFGAADGEVGGGRVSVEVRSVNHRFFSPSIKLPGVLTRWEGDVRDTMRRWVTRGHVTLFARFEREGEGDSAIALPIDEVRFAAYVEQLKVLQARYGLADALDLSTVLRLPDVFAAATREELPADAATQLVAIVERAVEALLVMRTTEGARLVDYLDQRISLIEQALTRIATRAPARSSRSPIVTSVELGYPSRKSAKASPVADVVERLLLKSDAVVNRP